MIRFSKALLNWVSIEGLRKTRNVSQDILSWDQDSNQGPAEYDAAVLLFSWRICHIHKGEHRAGDTLLVRPCLNALPAFSCLWARRSALLSFDICGLCQYFWGRQNGANSRRPLGIITNFGFICCIVRYYLTEYGNTLYDRLLWFNLNSWSPWFVNECVVDRPALFMCDWQYVKRQIEFSVLVHKISITSTHIGSYCCYDRGTLPETHHHCFKSAPG
jgi:hypothetical protein